MRLWLLVGAGYVIIFVVVLGWFLRCMMFSMMKREPVAIGFVGLDAFVFSVLGLLQVFGWVELSAEQNAAVVAFIAIGSAFLGGLVRSRVFPAAAVEAFVAEAASYADDAYLAGFDLGLFTPVPDRFVSDEGSGAEGS